MNDIAGVNSANTSSRDGRCICSQEWGVEHQSTQKDDSRTWTKEVVLNHHQDSTCTEYTINTVIVNYTLAGSIHFIIHSFNQIVYIDKGLAKNIGPGLIPSRGNPDSTRPEVSWEQKLYPALFTLDPSGATELTWLFYTCQHLVTFMNLSKWQLFCWKPLQSSGSRNHFCKTEKLYWHSAYAKLDSRSSSQMQLMVYRALARFQALLHTLFQFTILTIITPSALQGSKQTWQLGVTMSSVEQAEKHDAWVSRAFIACVWEALCSPHPHLYIPGYYILFISPSN